MTISQNLNELPPELNELKALKNWVCYKIEPRPTKDDPNHMGKVPYNLMTGKGARANDPGTWTDYETARKAAESGKYAGIGFEFGNSGYCGIDLDNCVTAEGKITDAAAEVVEKLNSYTEYSISGTGLHTIAKCSPLKKTGYVDPKKGDLKELEVYRPREKENGEFPGEVEGGRFFTISGNVYGEAKTIADRTEEIKALVKRCWPPEPIYPVETPRTTMGRAASGDDDSKMIDSALKAIPPGELNGYKEWGPIMSALYVKGYSYNYAEEWSSGRLNGTINPINNPVSNERRWNRGNFRLKDPANAGGIIIKTARRFGWTTADIDEETRREYGRSLYTEEQRKEYGRRKHEERIEKAWDKQRDAFQEWRKKRAAGAADPERNEPKTDDNKKITPEDLRAWMDERRARK